MEMTIDEFPSSCGCCESFCTEIKTCLMTGKQATWEHTSIYRMEDCPYEEVENGMTIAEPIQTLEYLKNSGVFPFSTVDGVLYTAESIDVVINTMRKYQELLNYIGAMNMCDEISNEAYRKIMIKFSE